MSVKTNAVVNAIGQGYVIAIAALVTPFYLQYVGPEAFGLIAFFTLFQAWMLLLDAGLSPAIGWQVATMRGRQAKPKNFLILIKSFEFIFIFIFCLVGTIFFFLNNLIVDYWITPDGLEYKTVEYCVSLFGFLIGFRLIAGLFRSTLNGFEDQVWVNFADFLVVTFKYLGSLFLLSNYNADIKLFFEYQCLIGVFEVILLRSRIYKKFSESTERLPFIFFDKVMIKPILPFAFGAGYSACVWVLVSQSDKIILSFNLPLEEFGYFSLVALICSGIALLTMPLTKALRPQLTVLFSQGKKIEALADYRQACQVGLLISLVAAITAGLFGEKLVYAWTGDAKAASWCGDVLLWFALGNGILGIASFQYLLQAALGQLRLHVLSSTISLIIQLPCMVYAAVNYGAVGAGIAWCLLRLLFFLFWSLIIHNRYAPGLHGEWLRKDIFPITLILCLGGLFVEQVFKDSYDVDRLSILFDLVLSGLGLLIIGSLGSSTIRRYFFKKIHKISQKNA